MKMKNSFRQSVMFLLFPLFVLACSPTQKGKIKLLKTPEEMQKQVNRFITVGMPIQKATHILEDSGFSCEDYKDTEFAVEDKEKEGILMKQTIFRGDFFDCTRQHSYIMAIQTWSFVLMYKKEKVTMVNAYVHSLQP